MSAYIFGLFAMCSLCVNAGDVQPLKVFGSAWGAFSYPENLDGLDEDSVVYCVGCCDDISHDVMICGALGCKVHLFDPSDVSKEHFDLVVGVLDGVRDPSEYRINRLRKRRYHRQMKNNHPQPGYWDMITTSGAKSENLYFHPVGLYTYDGEVTFYYNPVSEQGHIIEEHAPTRNRIEFTIPVKSLSTIMDELGHDHIDLLKIDIEGVECEVLNQMLDEGILPKYLSVDFDLGWTVHAGRNKSACLELIQRLKDVGYRWIGGKLPDVTFMLDCNDI